MEGAVLTNRRRSLKRPSNQGISPPGRGGRWHTVMCHRPPVGGWGGGDDESLSDTWGHQQGPPQYFVNKFDFVWSHSCDTVPNS